MNLRGRLSAFARLLGQRSGRSSADEYFSSAGALAGSGQHERAIQALNECLAIRPDYLDALLTLIQVLTHVGRYEEALEACARTLEVSPACDPASASLMQLLPVVGGLGDSDRVPPLLHRCFASYARLVESGTASASVISSMVQLLRLAARLKDSQKILPALDRCIAPRTEHTVFHLAKIDILLDCRRLRETLEACRRALEIDPLCIRAAQTIWQLAADPVARGELGELLGAPLPGVFSEYNNLLTRNIVEQLLAVMHRFYGDLGLNPGDAPLVQRLTRFYETLPLAVVEDGAPLLLRFESAWKHHADREDAKALGLFEGIFRDPSGRDALALTADAYLREAVVRSGEFLGRHQDKVGNTAAAISTYQDILSLHPSGVVARRLTVLLARTGKLQEAARMSSLALSGEVNLFPRLPGLLSDLIHAGIRDAHGEAQSQHRAPTASLPDQSRGGPAPGKPQCRLVCTVWGNEFTDFFCRFALPSLLVKDNLFWLSDNYEVTFQIYTSDKDLARMRGDRNFRKLAEVASIEPVLLDTLPPHHGHWVQWQHAALNMEASSSYILVIPDCVYANGALRRVAEALRTSDVVYFCLPQVSLECIAPQLAGSIRSAEGAEPYDYVDLSSLDIARLLVRHIHPKYAAATYRPDYLMTHPEYMVRPTTGQLDIYEFACHPLAFNGKATSLSYAFNPCAAADDTAFLDEILAIGCEYTLKYVEQYFRWPSHGAHLSRSVNLAGWAYHFREAGVTEYAKTNTRLKLSNGDVVLQERTVVSAPRVKYANFVLSYHAALYALYAGPALKCPPTVRDAIALAACLPGFRKSVARMPGPLTIFLPITGTPVPVLDQLYRSGSPREFMRFLLEHVVRGRLQLKEGQTFTLAPGPGHQNRFRTIDPVLAQSRPGATTGRVTSPPINLTNEILVYTAEMHYGAR